MSQGLLTFAPERKIFTVSELSLEIKGLLEKSQEVADLQEKKRMSYVG